MSSIGGVHFASFCASIAVIVYIEAGHRGTIQTLRAVAISIRRRARINYEMETIVRLVEAVVVVVLRKKFPVLSRGTCVHEVLRNGRRFSPLEHKCNPANDRGVRKSLKFMPD